MYIKGSNWNMQRKRQRGNPFRVIMLLLVVGVLIYFDRIVVPTIPPLFVATPTPTRPPESFITEAQKLEASGKYALAINAYNQAVMSDPRNPASYIALARLNIYTNNYSEAIKNAENALMVNQNNDTALALLGWAQGLAGDNLAAVKNLKEAIAINKDNAAAYAYLTEIYVYMMQAGQGDLDILDQARSASRTAVDLAPNSLETHRGRGFLLEWTANYEEAVVEFEDAVKINPNISDLHLELGNNYRSVEEYNKAITEYSMANSLNPNDPTPLTLISRTYLKNGDYPKAIQYGKAALVLRPTDPTLYGNLGLVYWKSQQYLEAVDVLRLAVRGGTSPDGAVVKGLELAYDRIGEYYYTYGLALAKSNQCGEALQIAQAVATGLRSDDIAQYNAQAVILICEQLAAQGIDNLPTATAFLAETPQETLTEAPSETPEATITPTYTP
jgi:tetratricopeptide (TPR) repeat protein